MILRDNNFHKEGLDIVLCETVPRGRSSGGDDDTKGKKSLIPVRLCEKIKHKISRQENVVFHLALQVGKVGFTLITFLVQTFAPVPSELGLVGALHGEPGSFVEPTIRKARKIPARHGPAISSN